MDCLMLKVHSPIQDEWGCQGNTQSVRCMSLMGHIAKGARPDVTFYECNCFQKHKICEACYIYFERVDRGKDGGSRPELLGKVLVLPRPRHEVLIYQFYMMPGPKECYA